MQHCTNVGNVNERNKILAGTLYKLDLNVFFENATWAKQAHSAAEGGSVMVTTPAAVKAFMLKLLELLHLLDTGQYPRNHSGLSHKVRRMLGLKSVKINAAALDKSAMHSQAERAVQLQQVWQRAV